MIWPLTSPTYLLLLPLVTQIQRGALGWASSGFLLQISCHPVTNWFLPKCEHPVSLSMLGLHLFSPHYFAFPRIYDYYYYFYITLIYYSLFTLISSLFIPFFVSFCLITKWISYTYTYIPISPPSCVSIPPSLSHPSRWTQHCWVFNVQYAYTIAVRLWTDLNLWTFFLVTLVEGNRAFLKSFRYFLNS